MAGSSKSIVPILPRPLKYLLLLIIFANFRSWPFVWHLKVFKPVLRIRLYQLYLLITRQPRKVQLEYKESLAPLGENPLEIQTVYDTWAGPDECDYNMHLSNSSYPKVLDSARFELAVRMFPSFLEQGGNVFLAGTHFNFMREIPIGSRYQVRVKVLAWDNKWIYVGAQYCLPPHHNKSSEDKKGKAKIGIRDTSIKFESRPARSGDRAGDEISSFGIMDESEAPSSSASGTSTPNGNGNGEASSSKPNGKAPIGNTPKLTKDGWVIACTSVSIHCFKYGRITIPPSLVYAVSGLMVNGKDEWNKLKRMKAAGEIKHLLKGGWRNVTPETESPMGKGMWWDEVMKREGVMDEVERRVEGGLGKLRESMEFAGTTY